MLSFQKWSQWENMNASVAGAVTSGVCYQDLKTFNRNYIHHHFVPYIFHGLYPSQQV